MNTLTRIPKRIKLPIYIISSLIFVLLQFRFAELVTIKLTNFLLELTDYHFVISTNTLDYLAVASIPFFGLLLFSKRKRQPKRLLIQDILAVFLFVIVVVIIGLFAMTLDEADKNSLLPSSLLEEPFDLLSTILVILGIIIPFILRKLFKKRAIVDQDTP